MVTARVSSKGQITIPSAIRRALGVAQGDEVVLTVDGDEARLKVVKRRRLTHFTVRSLPNALTRTLRR